MTPLIRAASLLALLPCALPAHADWRAAGDMAALVAELDRWLDTHSDLLPRPLPRVRVVAHQDLLALHGALRASDGRLRGLYDAERGEILLGRPWSPRDGGDVSVLLHELAHHRQAGRHYVCAGAMEEAAYRLQAAWAEEMGAQIDIDWFSVVWAGGCRPRDIHP